MSDINHASGHRQRLKQRFLNGGLKAVADYELLELLLMQAIPRRDVKPLAKDLLKKFKGLSGVLSASEQDLKSVKGVGDNVLFTLKLSKGLAEAYRKDILHKPRIHDKIQLLDYLYAKMDGLKHEEFHAVFLDSKNHILADDHIFRGTVNKSAAYPREVMKEAINKGATAVIIVHNHPSGDPSPSRDDDILTVEMFTAAQTLGIQLVDHIIIGHKVHYSFKDHGKL